MVQAKSRAPARGKILEAAVAVFSREGFQAASIDTIAETAGVSRRTIYHHFETKNAILVAATLEQAHLFLEQLRVSVLPGDDFAAFVVESLCFVIRESPGSRFFMLQMARGVGTESATVYFNEPSIIEEWVAHFQEPYVEALRRGQLNPAITLRELLPWFGRIATSFLQYPATGGDEALRATLDVFVGGALRYGALSR
jgi:AcrR family transcriptional regulator